MLKVGEVCAGYGGLSLAIEEVFGAETVWFSEFEDAPSRILAHHWPTVPNHGDMTKINWASVEPVDIISGGTPCQDLSAAGKRAGMNEGTRSNLWVQMREAIAVIKPTYVVWENVRGAYSAEAHSSLEHCAGCMGDPADRGTVLRALGRVLGDLSDLGYDCQWRGLRAADVGAPHGRFRVFVLATYAGRVGRNQTIEHYGRGTTGSNRTSVPSQSDRDTLRVGSEREDAAYPISEHRGKRWDSAPSQAQSRRASAVDSRCGGTPTASDADSRGLEWNQKQDSQSHAPGTSEARKHPDGCGVGSERVEPWGHASAMGQNWGPYERAIRRWESVLGRCAPAPTEPTGRNGGHRLSARFCEWMMGVPDGWIVDVPGITRNQALKAAGNGVVPQQAIAALRDMLAASERSAA